MLARMKDDLRTNETKTIEKHGSRALTKIDISEIPSRHPAAMIDQVYRCQISSLPAQHLPSLEALSPSLGHDLLDYCIVMTPREADPFIDFIVEHCGRKTPGSTTNAHPVGALYTESILPFLANERLMELTSCLSLKRCRFSRTFSARPSSLNVRIFRAVFPVWYESLEQHAIVLAVAPVHIELPAARL